MKQRSNRPSKAKMRDWKIQLHRREFQLALLKEGLFLELEKSVDSDAVYVKVLAPFWRLAEEAQKTNCKADLAVGGGQTLCVMQVQPRGMTRKRGLILGQMGARDSFTPVVVGICIMMRTESRNHPYGRKMGLRSALRRGAYQKLYALHDGSFRLHSKSIHDANQRAQLRIKWAKRFWRSQPLDLVNAYYGERIGVYFAWLGHYTKWLTLPAAVGMAVFVYGIINAARLNKLDATPNALFAIFDNVLTMPFALFMSMWSTVYIEFWKRANQYYAFRWNMSDYERVELPRTEFRATKVRFSPVTGKRELYYPMYWKALRILASSLAVLVAVAVVIGSVACLMIFKAWCRHHIGGPYATVVATAILNLIIIIILGEIWCRLAEWLTDKENHKYTDAYEDSLIIKRYLFDFTNMYATLFYYAFFKAPFGGRIFRNRPDLQDACLYDACITELTVQLAVVFIGKQFLNGLFEMVFPWIKRTWNRKKILADQALKNRKFMETRKRTKAPQWVKDDELPSYQGRILKCYRKTVIQFGFCTLFVTSFPVAPAFALINNWIDIRMEAFRLLTQYRRPIAYRAQDIGMWELIMEFVSFTSVITNAAIIAFSSLWVKQNIFIKVLHATADGELLAARLGFILVFEHVVYLFKIILRAAIPNVPLTIKLAVQRSKYMTRVANEGLDSEVDEDLDLDYDSGSQTDDEGNENEGDAGSNDSDPGPQSGIGLQERRSRQTGSQDRSTPTNSGLKKRRPLFGLQRLWNRAATRKQSSGGNVSDRESTSLPQGNEGPASVLPTIQESAPSVRSNSVFDPQRDEMLVPRLQAPRSVDASGEKQQQQQGQHLQTQHGLQSRIHPQRPPLLNTDQLNTGASSSQRRPVPQRANTDMDGEWVVLEEARM
ncbi:Anoctamin-5 [Mortierella alpina]|nr:Anoctamin-5 [Mortierella alpina]